MHRLALASICCTMAVVGCSKAEPRAADSTAQMAPAPAAVAPAPAALTAADVAGRWKMRTMNEAGDSTLVEYVMDAPPGLTGATITFPNRKPIAAQITVMGDSVVTDAGPYESVLRKGVQVSTHGVSRMQNGKLVGVVMAHYRSRGADSLRTLRVEGTKGP